MNDAREDSQVRSMLGDEAVKVREEWHRPTYRKVDASEAETGGNSGGDIIFS